MTTNYAYARLLLLQPTSPYRSVAEIRAAMTQLEEEDADLIASVSTVPDESSLYLIVKIDDDQMVTVLPGQVPTGNSSVAVREGAYLSVPSVDIGSRQGERDKSGSIVEVEFNKNKIVSAVQAQMRVEKGTPDLIYGDGHSGDRIAIN